MLKHVTAVLVVALLANLGGCGIAEADARTKKANAAVSAYNRWVTTSNDFGDAWLAYSTATGSGRRVEALRRCLSIAQSLDTTTGSEMGLAVLDSMREWKQSRIVQVNAYITAEESVGGDWSAVKASDKAVEKANASMKVWEKTFTHPQRSGK